MSSGYGRGYYGERQLAPKAPRRRGWIKLAVVVGVGAVVWLMWPRKYAYAYVPDVGSDAPKPPVPPPFPPPEAPSQQLAQLGTPQQLQLGAPQLGAPQQLQLGAPQLDQLAIAQARGYSSQKAYEDAVVASARQLQETGAKVVLASHLQHLAPRLES